MFRIERLQGLWFTLACLVLIEVFSGCASVYQELEVGKLYRRDAKIKINNAEFEGVVVVPQANEYNFTVEAKGGIDLLILRSCHREYVAEKIDPGFLGLGGKQFKYTYRPIPGLEDKGFCPLRMDFFESAKEGRHSWSFMDFQNSKFTVPGLMYCSGEVKAFRGITVCQSKESLIQRISFSERVEFGTPRPKGCNMPVWLENSVGTYEIKVSPGECLYPFRTEGDTKEHWQRGYLTMIGYSGILVREGQ